MELRVTIADFGPCDVKLLVAEATPDVPGNELVLPPSSESVFAIIDAAGQVPEDAVHPPSATCIRARRIDSLYGQDTAGRLGWLPSIFALRGISSDI